MSSLGSIIIFAGLLAGECCLNYKQNCKLRAVYSACLRYDLLRDRLNQFTKELKTARLGHTVTILFPSAVGTAIVDREPPTMLRTAIVEEDSVAYAWSNPDNACQPSTINLYQRMLNDSMVVNVAIPNGPGPLGSDAINGLTPFTIYSVVVRYVCADGTESPFSSPLVFQTLQGSEHHV